MIKVTIQDIIAFLPFDEAYKKEMQDRLKKADLGASLGMEDLLWQTYDTLCDLYYQKNLQKAQLEVKAGRRIMGPDFYKLIRQETNKEIEADMAKKTTAFGIEEVRQKLQHYMQEPK